MIPSISQSNVQAALRAFMLAVLPADVEVISAVNNRVPEPSSSRFAVIGTNRFVRFSTNVDGSADVRFTGSISGTTMTVSAVQIGTIILGAVLFGVGVLPGTTIVSQVSGTPGGAGVYAVSLSQALASQTLASGAKSIALNTEIVLQIDFHAADNTAADLAQTISAMLRDEFALEFFGALAPPLDGVAPLYADDPRYMPFINEAQQYEWRFVLDVHMQANQVFAIPQQYADAVTVVLESVDVVAPP